MVLGETLTIPGFVTELLWSNASPTGTFNEQTITIANLSEYAFLIISFNDPARHEWIPNIVGQGIYVHKMNGSSTGGAERRMADIQAGNKIHFTSVMATGGTAYQNHVVPVAVRGIRGADK